MLRTYFPDNSNPVVERVDNSPTLTWLLATNRYEAQRQRLFRKPNEEEQILLMRHPVTTPKAYALLGLLLGALPPAAIFVKLFGYGLGLGQSHVAHDNVALFFLCLLMNIVCAVGGFGLGLAFAQKALILEHSSLIRMFLLMPLLGAAWGMLTGMSGGFFFFIFGSFFGAAFGAVVGFVGFLIFAIVHRALERGGMIEARHLAPLACGIAATITSLVLGL